MSPPGPATRRGFTPMPGFGLGGLIDAAPATETPHDDAFWMRRALQQAMTAVGRASPNPTVGAVIVKDGRLIAAGATEEYGGRHAERCAIDSVADRSVLRGATLYSTLEPCAHWGKQPPCADLVAACGFARCVVGIQDPNPEVAGAGLAKVRAAGAEVRSGVLRNEVIAWHLPYLLRRIADRPLVSVLTSPTTADRRYREWLCHKADIVVAAPTTLPAAGQSWRGVLWWDAGGLLAATSVARLREAGEQARAARLPVALVCTPDDDNAEQIAACAAAGIPRHVLPADADPAAWLRLGLAGGEFAAVGGEAPAWVVVDGPPELAARLAGGDAADVIHDFAPAISERYTAPLISALETPTW